MLELLYTALLYLIQPLIWIRLWVRGRKAPAYRKRWGERYGFYRHPLKPGGIMLHSVSVGETLAAIPLVRALRHRYPDLPITVTTMTPTGSERVQSAFGKDVQQTGAVETGEKVRPHRRSGKQGSSPYLSSYLCHPPSGGGSGSAGGAGHARPCGHLLNSDLYPCGQKPAQGRL